MRDTDINGTDTPRITKRPLALIAREIERTLLSELGQPSYDNAIGVDVDALAARMGMKRTGAEDHGRFGRAFSMAVRWIEEAGAPALHPVNDDGKRFTGRYRQALGLARIRQIDNARAKMTRAVKRTLVRVDNTVRDESDKDIVAAAQRRAVAFRREVTIADLSAMGVRELPAIKSTRKER